MIERTNISSGTAWETAYGYSRAVRVGNTVHVAGTTAVDEAGQVVGAGSPYEQARFILAKIEHALQDAGGQICHVVCTRIYATEVEHLLEAGRAHGEVFREVRPVATGVVVKSLIQPDLLVEIEAIALIADSAHIT